MTGGEAYKAKLITDDALAGGVSAYLADPAAVVAIDVAGAPIDVAAAVAAHPYAVEVLARPDASEGQRRNAVRTAILLARVGA